jgi:hypothetical protein
VAGKQPIQMARTDSKSFCQSLNRGSLDIKCPIGDEPQSTLSGSQGAIPSGAEGCRFRPRSVGALAALDKPMRVVRTPVKKRPSWAGLRDSRARSHSSTSSMDRMPPWLGMESDSGEHGSDVLPKYGLSCGRWGAWLAWSNTWHGNALQG